MLTLDEVNSDYNIGLQDGTSASVQSSQDLLEYFGLKKKLDPRVKGTTFEQFLEKKEQGAFADFDVREDSYLKALFLQ